MKELSIEEKAKRYDEAIKLAKDSFNYPSYPGFIRADVVFPELKESEDERIRKALIRYFTLSDDNADYQCCGVHCKDILAYLEKQGEHAKFLNKIQIGDKVTRNQDGVLVNLSQLKRVAKPAEEYNITGIGSKNAQGKLGEMIKNLKPVNEILEQKPAWSEEDEKMIRALVSMCDVWATSHQFYPKENKEMEAVKTWLKSLKNRVQPQPKQEWSEEDEDKMQIIINIIKDSDPDWEELINWLKSLIPQNTWKPSEEQLKSLEEVIDAGHYTSYPFALETLYKQLKQL